LVLNENKVQTVYNPTI